MTNASSEDSNEGSERSRACDRTDDDRLTCLAFATDDPGAESETREILTGDLRALVTELRDRRGADPTIDELTALVDIRDRLVRINVDALAGRQETDPSARLAKRYLDRVLMKFLHPLLERGNRRSP